MSAVIGTELTMFCLMSNISLEWKFLMRNCWNIGKLCRMFCESLSISILRIQAMNEQTTDNIKVIAGWLEGFMNI